MPLYEKCVTCAELKKQMYEAKNRQKTHKKQYSCNVLTECDNSKMTSITQRAKTRE